MKTLVFLLVLANLLFYAFAEGYFGRPDNPDAQRMAQQQSPEKVKILSRGEPPARSEKKAPPEPVKEEPALACLTWSDLAARDADRIASLVAERFEGYRVSRQESQPGEIKNWWVFIPPLPGKPEADKKAGELRGMGITDYFIIQDNGPNRFAISLGVFSTESGAQDRLASLKEQGVRSAKLAPRGNKESLFSLEARGPQAQASAVRDSINGLFPERHAADCK